MNDNKNTKRELIIELRAYINLIEKNSNLKQEIKLAMYCIYQLLDIIVKE